MKDYDHPAMFPEELPRRVMKLFSYKNDLILDPFNGAGTTTLVAQKLGRRFIGIDISGQYSDQAIMRLAASSSNKCESESYPAPKRVQFEEIEE